MSIVINKLSAETHKYEPCALLKSTVTEASSSILPYPWPGTTYDIVVVEGEAEFIDSFGTPPLDDMASSISTNTTTGNVPLVRLEEYASAGMFKEFSQLAEAIEWAAYNPEELLWIIDLALRFELASLAMRLAQEGSKLFPNHKRMQKAGRILTPPVIRRAVTSQVQSQTASQQWLYEHSSQYHGKWVAVRAGTLLGVADSLADLLPIIGKDTEALNTLVTKVL